MKKCSNPECGCLNENTALFCRQCGTQLEQSSYFPDNFPELNLIPKDYMKLKKDYFAFSFSFTMTIFFSVFVWWILIHSCIGGLLGILISSGSAVTFMFFCTKKLHQSFCPTLSRIDIDYIQVPQKNQEYAIIVKNKKFGLINIKKLKIIIPTKYDSLRWKEYNMILEATSEGKTIFLDTKNKSYL